MRLWKGKVLLALSLCLLPGCLTLFKYSGTEIKAAHVAKIQPGITLKRDALEFVPPERLIPAPDCGMKYLPRDVAFRKLHALVQGTAIVRAELGISD